MSTPLRVRGIRAPKHKSGEFAALSLYFPGKNNTGQLVYASLTCKIHLVEDLKANLLIGNDIMSPEGFVIDVKGKSALIRSCGVTVFIDTRQRGQFLTRKLLASQEIVLPPQSEAMVLLVPIPLPHDRNFLFYPATQANLTLFTHIVDHQTSKVFVRNVSNETLRIPRCHKLGHLINIAYDNCFLTNTQSTFDAATSQPLSYRPLSCNNKPSFLPTNPSLETVLDNEVNVYRDAAAVRQIVDLVAEYLRIWESQGFVYIPPKRWRIIPLKPSWESNVSAIKPQIYPLGNKARRVVNNTFDEMYKQGRLEYTTDLTPFSFPVFIIYKTNLHDKRKCRVVVDIRKLNNLVLPDSYPLPLQSKIIANVQGYKNLTVLNAASFIYHWRLHPDHCLMFIVITHRRQETF